MKQLTMYRRARALLAKPGKWNQGYYGLSRNGDYVWPTQPAVSFCAIGALAKVGKLEPGDELPLLAPLKAALPKNWKGRSIARYNDAPHRKVEDILALYDRAIAAIEADEAVPA